VIAPVFFKERIEGIKNPSNINPNPQALLHPPCEKYFFAKEKSGTFG